MGTPIPPVGGKAVPRTTTIDETAAAFHGLLFPPEETQDDQPEGATATDGVEPEGSEEQPEVTETADAPPVDAEPEPATEPQPTARSRKLKLDGKEVEVSEDEAYLGYMRQQDYTRKTQELAERRKTLDSEAEGVTKQRAEYAAYLDQVKKGLQAMVPKEPNWQELRAALTPEEFAGAVANYQTWKSNVDAVDAEQRRVAAEQEAELVKVAQKQYEAQQERLLEVFPEWRDEAKFHLAQSELVGWLRSKGYSDEEIAGIRDARTVENFWNAMQFAKGKQKPGKRAPRTVAPGGGITPPAPKDAANEARGRLAKSGSIDDAADVFLRTLKNL